MMNLTGYKPVKLDVKNLPLEDRWILSRLATTTKNVTEAIDKYQHADAARMIYDFAWDEFCSYYVEMAKPRLQDAASRPATQQVLIHTLDQLLRLLHPMTPFITEAIWQELARFGDVRTLDGDAESQKWLIRSAWPEAKTAHIDQVIEQQFARFVTALGALREIRSRQNLPPKEEITFTISCDTATQTLLEPMVPFFKALAGATCTGLGEKLAPPEMSAQVSVDGMEVSVDLGKFIDIPAEIARNEKLQANLVKQIAGKESKLSNSTFVDRAPADVVAKERESLEELRQQLANVTQALERLKATNG